MKNNEEIFMWKGSYLARSRLIKYGTYLKQVGIGLFSFLFIMLAQADPPLLEVPNGGNIVAGQATIIPNTGNLQVNQSTQSAIINWQNFNIGQNATVVFTNQNPGGVVLNRAANPAQIYGNLKANESVFLVSPGGIYIGPNAFINVSGIFIGTTSNITNENFMKGNYNFNIPTSDSSASIINQGTVKANGLVALVAPTVVNNGMIQASAVVLSTGETAVSFGNNNISFKVGDIKGTGINNAGTIITTPKVVSKILDNTINVPKTMVAQSATQLSNGDIILDAGNSNATVGGKLIASSTTAPGGLIKIRGKHIQIASKANMDVSGYGGGGTITIGGNLKGSADYIGQDLIPNADTTYVDTGVQLTANALTFGNGGNIIVWSNKDTRFLIPKRGLGLATSDPTILLAQGGLKSGNGGLIETSGGYLETNGIGSVNTTAPKGKTGTWLIDPYNVTISTSATSGGTFSGGNPNQFNPSTTSNIKNTDITSALDNTNVKITTNPSSGTDAGNITVNAGLTTNWKINSTLTLEANSSSNVGGYGSIMINSDITASHGGNLVLDAKEGNIAIDGKITLKLDASSLTTDGKLTLLAKNTNTQSLTSGTITATKDIDVNNFELSKGQWFQADPTPGGLPNLKVKNDFHVASGTQYNHDAGFSNGFNGQFTRLVTTSPTLSIADVFGLQGVATGPLSQSYILSGDINAGGADGNTSLWDSGAGFVPIGSQLSAGGGTVNGYTGTFGKSNAVNSISNLTINRPTQNFIGLFGSLGIAGGVGGSGTGTVQNITLTNVNVTGKNVVGGVVGSTWGSSVVKGVITSGTVKGNSIVGGIAGQNLGSSSIIGAHQVTRNDSTVQFNDIAGNTAGGPFGGIVGLNRANIGEQTPGGGAQANTDWVINRGNITGSGGAVGGIAGSSLNYNPSQPLYTYNPVIKFVVQNDNDATRTIASNAPINANPSANKDLFYGFIVGNNSGIVDHAYVAASSMQITVPGTGSGFNYFMGGIVGKNDKTPIGSGSVTNSFYTGSSQSGTPQGNNESILKLTIPTGITGGNFYVGGIAGMNSGTLNTNIVSKQNNINPPPGNTGNIGIVKTGTQTGNYWSGGIVGYNDSNGTVLNSTIGTPNPVNINVPTGSGSLFTGKIVGNNAGTFTTCSIGTVNGPSANSGNNTGSMSGGC